MADVSLKEHFNKIIDDKNGFHKSQIAYIRDKIQELREYTNAQLTYIYDKFKSERELTEQGINSIKIQLESMKEFTEIQAQSIKEATDIVAKSMDDRFAKTNEFREVLNNQQKTFIARDEHSAVIGKIDKEIQELMQSKAKLEGMATQKSVTITLIFTVVAIAISMFALVLNISRG